MSGRLNASAVVLLGKSPWYLLNRRLDAPECGVDDLGKNIFGSSQ